MNKPPRSLVPQLIYRLFRHIQAKRSADFAAIRIAYCCIVLMPHRLDVWGDGQLSRLQYNLFRSTTFIHANKKYMTLCTRACLVL